MIGQDCPFLYIETDVIGEYFTLISGKHCHVFSHLPYLFELNVVARHYGILNFDSLLRNGLKQIFELLTW